MQPHVHVRDPACSPMKGVTLKASSSCGSLGWLPGSRHDVPAQPLAVYVVQNTVLACVGGEPAGHRPERTALCLACQSRLWRGRAAAQQNTPSKAACGCIQLPSPVLPAPSPVSGPGFRQGSPPLRDKQLPPYEGGIGLNTTGNQTLCRTVGLKVRFSVI